MDRFTKIGIRTVIVLAAVGAIGAAFDWATGVRQRTLASYSERSRRMADRHCKAAQAVKDEYLEQERVLFSCDDGFRLQ